MIINEIFNSDLGSQCDFLFSTPDNRIFIRYKEALSHCEENNLNFKEIKQLFR